MIFLAFQHLLDDLFLFLNFYNFFEKSKTPTIDVGKKVPSPFALFRHTTHQALGQVVNSNVK
jgi:hypothetical protein